MILVIIVFEYCKVGIYSFTLITMLLHLLETHQLCQNIGFRNGGSSQVQYVCL